MHITSGIALNYPYCILGVFKALLRAGVEKPAPAAYGALLRSIVETTSGRPQKVSKALEVYSDMLRKKVVPDSATFALRS